MGDVGVPRLSAELERLRLLAGVDLADSRTARKYVRALEAELVVVRERAERLSKLIVEQEREYAKERKTLRERAEREKFELEAGIEIQESHRLAAEERAERLERERNELLNEVDCRIEHGAESGGHLEYVRNRLSAALAQEDE